MAGDRDVIAYLLKLEDQMSQGFQAATQRADELEDQLVKLEKQNQQGVNTDGKRRSSIKQLGSAFGVAAKAGAVLGTAFVAMGGMAVKTSANLEAFETRLGGLLGGLDQGKARVAELFEIASRTPFSVEGLVEAETTLEAFGVNAQRVRGGVMDLAGALGMDVTEAAGAVGKALAGGAGAADILREKGVLTMVEITAGMSTAEMSADQFRAALVKTLETNDKLAGGTAKLAATFSGLFSTLKDQFVGFSKQVGDADLFLTTKATMMVVLDLLERNKQKVAELAGMIGSGLAKALIFVVDSFFDFLALIQDAKAGFAMMEIGARKLADALGFGDSSADIKQLETDFDAAFNKAREFREEGSRVATEIETLARAMGNAAEASAQLQTPGGVDPNQIMTVTGIEKGGGKQADEAATPATEFLEKIAGSAEKARSASEALARQLDDRTASEKLADQINQLTGQMGIATMQAQQLGVDVGGPEMQGFFGNLQEQIAQTTEAYNQALSAEQAEKMAGAAQAAETERQKQAELERIAREGAQKVGNAMSGSFDALSSGGLSALSMAGPVGGGIASAISFGQQGDAAFDAEASKVAGEAAKDRQQGMKDEAAQLKAQGMSEGQLAAKGLDQKSIAEAGEVTDEDIAEAEGGIDRGEMMAGVVKQAVEGVIDGIASLLEGLPDILMDLIPMLLVDLPKALTEMLPTLIEELIPVLIFELPKAIFKMLIDFVPRMLKLFFLDLPKALFNGIAQWWSKVWKAIKDFFSFSLQTGGYVPRTGLALVHQGERVIPSNGAGTGTATAGLQAFTGGPGRTLTINTATVDPDSIPALGRLLERDLGAHGRVENDLFGRPSPLTSL